MIFEPGGDPIAGQAVRISLAVDLLVMAACNLGDGTKIAGKMKLLEDRFGLNGMGVHLFPLFGGEDAIFQQNGVADPDFADVVEHRRQPEHLDVVPVEIKLPGNQQGIFGD